MKPGVRGSGRKWSLPQQRGREATQNQISHGPSIWVGVGVGVGRCGQYRSIHSSACSGLCLLFVATLQAPRWSRMALGTSFPAQVFQGGCWQSCNLRAPLYNVAPPAELPTPVQTGSRCPSTLHQGTSRPPPPLFLLSSPSVVSSSSVHLLLVCRAERRDLTVPSTAC